MLLASRSLAKSFEISHFRSLNQLSTVSSWDLHPISTRWDSQDLPETSSEFSPENGWLEYYVTTFLLGRLGIKRNVVTSGAIVSFREGRSWFFLIPNFFQGSWRLDPFCRVILSVLPLTTVYCFRLVSSNEPCKDPPENPTHPLKIGTGRVNGIKQKPLAVTP